jgi:hypothetical protein
MAKGFPSRNPRRRGGITKPVKGSLREWLSWNFPTVSQELSEITQDAPVDNKGTKYNRKHPVNTGIVPRKR